MISPSSTESFIFFWFCDCLENINPKLLLHKVSVEDFIPKNVIVVAAPILKAVQPPQVKAKTLAKSAEIKTPALVVGKKVAHSETTVKQSTSKSSSVVISAESTRKSLSKELEADPTGEYRLEFIECLI